MIVRKNPAPVVSIRKDKPSWAKPLPPFDLHRDLRQFVSITRIPVLSTHLTQEDHLYQGWEQRRKVQLRMSRRYRNSERAVTADAYVLSYVASEATRHLNRAGVAITRLDIKPRHMLDAMALPSDDDSVRLLVQALRRLTATVIDVRNWGPRAFADRSPLLQIQAVSDHTYRLYLSDWLQEELFSHRVIKISPEALRLKGLQGLLYGWAVGRVGPEHCDGRIIRQREALARAGSFPSGCEPWEEIVQAVGANDVPGFKFALETFEGLPAIAVTPRGYHSEFDMPSFTLEMDFPSPEPIPLPREITI